MKQVFSLLSFILLTTAVFSQDSSFQQQITFSAPGPKHALLGTLAGNWNFQDAKLPFVKGTVSRKPMYDGRFYLVEVTGGRLQVPVAGGKMKEDNYHEMQIDGYDNARRQFVTTSINNHIGSDIELQTGTYDSTTKTLTYIWTSELVPGVKTQSKRTLKLVDKAHYVEEFYESGAGKEVKTRELNYTRVTEK